MRCNKKGNISGSIIIGLVLAVLIMSSFVVYFFKTVPANKPTCESQYKQYDLNLCINNLKDIQLCDRLNATYVSTVIHLYSSNEVKCYKNGEAFKV